MARVAVTPSVLAWAMEDAARDVHDLAIATTRDDSIVESWLAGAGEPHLGDLRKIAALLGRSPYFFSLPEPPDEPQYSAQFRTALKKSLGPEERAKEIAALRWGQRIQRTADALRDTDESLTLPDISDDPERAATTMQTWLKWSTQSQVKASSKTAAFRLLRSAIEAQGIIVTMRSAGTSAFCGYSLPDDRCPLIFINKDYDLASVRSYTLLHELAHVAHHQRRICYGRDKGIERWCNRFAAAFLMPASHVEAYIDRQKISFSSYRDTDPVRLVANRYKTSWEAAAIRLDELGLAPAGLVQYIRSTRPEKPENAWAPPGSRHTATMRLEEFGATFTRLLGDGVLEGRCSSLDARKQLRVTGRQLNETVRLAWGPVELGDSNSGSKESTQPKGST